MRTVLDTIRKQTYKCIKLQEIASSDKVSFEEGQRIRKEQDYEYKKLQWMKNINKAMEKQNRKDGEKNDRNAKESSKNGEPT